MGVGNIACGSYSRGQRIGMTVSDSRYCRGCCDRRSGGRVYDLHHRAHLISKLIDIMGARVNLLLFCDVVICGVLHCDGCAADRDVCFACFSISGFSLRCVELGE